jgi:hypothetical protein
MLDHSAVPSACARAASNRSSAPSPGAHRSLPRCACAQVVPCSDVDKVMLELKGHAPGITRYVLDIAGTIDDFGKEAGK